MSTVSDKLELIADILTDVLNEIRDLKEDRKYEETPGRHPPYIPSPLPHPSIPEINRKIVCSKCGVELGNTTSYVCPVPSCPTGLGPLVAST